MKFKYIVFLALTALFLTACGNEKAETNSNSANDGETASDNSALEHGVTDQSEVGFEMAGGKIEEAKDVPKEERQAILTAFDTYMTAFNEEDLETYLSVIASNPEGFDYAEEKEFVEDTFAEYNVNRTAEDITLIKYDENQAQVFATLQMTLEQETTGAQVNRSGRQVTVFTNEDGEWRVTSVFFIGDTAE